MCLTHDKCSSAAEIIMVSRQKGWKRCRQATKVGVKAGHIWPHVAALTSTIHTPSAAFLCASFWSFPLFLLPFPCSRSIGHQEGLLWCHSAPPSAQPMPFPFPRCPLSAIRTEAVHPAGVHTGCLCGGVSSRGPVSASQLEQEPVTTVQALSWWETWNSL